MAKLPESDQAAKTEAKNGEADEATGGPKPSAAASRKVRGHVFINEERCKGCSLCITFCPSHVLERSARFNSRGYHPPEATKPENCTGCDICGYFCPDFAIYGVRITEKSGEAKSAEPAKKD